MKRTTRTGKTANRYAGSTKGTHGRRGTEGLDHLDRIHASLQAAAAIAKSLDARLADQVRLSGDPADKVGQPSDLPFRVDAMAFAIAVDSELLFTTLGRSCRIPTKMKDRARSVLEAGGGLSDSLESITRALDEQTSADLVLPGSLRNMARVVDRLRKGLDILYRSWIVADLCLLALIGRVRAGTARTPGEAGLLLLHRSITSHGGDKDAFDGRRP